MGLENAGENPSESSNAGFFLLVSVDGSCWTEAWRQRTWSAVNGMDSSSGPDSFEAIPPSSHERAVLMQQTGHELKCVSAVRQRLPTATAAAKAREPRKDSMCLKTSGATRAECAGWLISVATRRRFDSDRRANVPSVREVSTRLRRAGRARIAHHQRRFTARIDPFRRARRSLDRKQTMVQAVH